MKKNNVINFDSALKKKKLDSLANVEITYQVEIVRDGRFGAHVTVTQKKSGNLFGSCQSTYVESFFNVEKKAQKAAEKMIANWKKREREAKEKTVYTIQG